MKKPRFDSVSPPLRHENVAVPFCLCIDNGQRYLTDLQLAKEPHLRDFVDRFSNSFTHDELRQVWWLT